MIEISMKAKGLEQMTKRLEALQRMGGTFKGVDLLDTDREPIEGYDSGLFHNTGILEQLKETGRDFVSETPELMERIAGAFAAAYDKIIQAARIDDPVRLAKNAAGKGLTEAMREYMKEISRRIDSQQTVNGTLKPLSQSYAARKRKRFGFETPIGKASGQLIENLNPTGPAGRIKIIR